MKAALYARVSTKKQDVGMQLDELRRVAIARDWQVVEYIDKGISGTKESRPALNRLMTDAHRGAFGVVMVWKFDRFARSTRHLLQSLEVFQAKGIEFVSVREQIDTTTPIGKALFTVISVIAELERDLIRERIVTGIERARAKGKRFGRTPRFIEMSQVRRLQKEGKTIREISQALKIPKTTLHRRTTAKPPLSRKAS